MNLKILIFPLSIAASIMLLVFFTKPEYEEIKKLKAEIREKESQLNVILSKEGNIKKLAESLRQNRDKVLAVESFFPEKRNEEDIIHGLNFLAGQSGITLSGLFNAEKKASAPIVTQSQETQPTSSAEAIWGKKKEEGEEPVAKLLVPAETVSSTYGFSAIGLFENVSSLLDAIYRLEMFNEISSILISKPKKEKTGEEEANSDVPPGMLILAVGLDFIEMPKVKIGKNYDSPLFSKESFDFKAYEAMYSLIRKKVPSLGSEPINRNNPFLP